LLPNKSYKTKAIILLSKKRRRILLLERILQRQILLLKNYYKIKTINVLLSGTEIKKVLLLGKCRTKRILQKILLPGKYYKTIIINILLSGTKIKKMLLLKNVVRNVYYKKVLLLLLLLLLLFIPGENFISLYEKLLYYVCLGKFFKKKSAFFSRFNCVIFI